MLQAPIKQESQKMERRLSNTSESSIEPMDLGRTSTNTNGGGANRPPHDRDSDDNYESDDYTSKERRRRLSGSKTIVQIESDNPNSLRKKFRISSSTPNRNLNNNNNNNNYETTASTIKTDESGFVDASSQSLNLTASRNPNCTSSSSSAGSSPAASSSPESGIGERDDIKFICPICEVVSATAHEFTNHIRCHNYSSADSENFTCQICSKVLSSASSLDRHVLVHTGERPFNCKYCHLTFTTNGNMHRHMRTHKQHPQQHHRRHSNGAAKTSSVPPPQPLSANGKSGGESYESDGCSTDSSSAASHSHSNNNNTIHAPHSFKRKSTDSLDDSALVKRRLKTTINNNTIISEGENEPKFACPVCSQDDFTSMPGLGMHMDHEHPDIPAKCRHCDVVFKTHKQLNVHRCSAKFDFSSEKFPLIAKSLCEQSMTLPKFECAKCSRAFPCTSSVEAHSRSCGVDAHVAQDFSVRKPRTESEHSSGDEEEDHEAQRRAQFFAHFELRNKSGQHDDESVVKSEQDSLNYSHEGLQDFADIPSILNVTSSSSNNFLRNFDKCVSNTGSTFSLDREEEEAQDAFTVEFRKMKLRGEFPCKLCSAVFPNLRALKGHNRIHLSAAGTGPFRCNICPFSIHDKAALNRHMKIHNGDRPYECAVCKFAFTTKANCERHLRNTHRMTTRDAVKQALIYHPAEDSSCDDPMKKLRLFSSPDFDQDDIEPIHAPMDRSTPVSHLKEMLQAEAKSAAVKIQVKSMDKLMDKNSFEEEQAPAEAARPIDLSMDVLDLSKKTKVEKKPEVKEVEPELDMSQQLLRAQQQFFSEAFPKMDPAHYFQLSQLYRNFVYPPLNPFFLQNSFLQNGLGDLKFPPLLNPSMFANPAAAAQPNLNESTSSTDTQPQVPSKQMPPMPSQQLPKPSSAPAPSASAPHINIPQHQPMPHHHSPLLPSAANAGPVKMVIKNGVLMPKQKQRRYRTERPFACEHCSARFTLRSNMERHIKQQHPQYWAQRQRSGHNIMRGRAPGTGGMPHLSPGPPMPGSHLSVISDQVKYAILAQQLKARNESDILHQALSQGSSMSRPQAQHPSNAEDDDPKLVIDEDEEGDDEDNFDDGEDVEEYKAEDLTNKEGQVAPNEAAKKVAETILEQAIKAGGSKDSLKMSNNLIADAPSVRKYLKEVACSAFKDESSDLASVSKLVDNATNPMSFNSYFRPSDAVNHLEESDEEGLVASGSAESESNHSGAEEASGNGGLEPKKKSAYSLAPNRVTCMYCPRIFPWMSSLRRHVLTHTGQKPFKCSHCPLLFTTKSNCDRHLLRKHSNVASAVSLYLPIEDIPESLPVPKSVEELEKEQPKKPALPAQPAAQPVKPEHPLSVSSSDLPFKCHLCDNSFAERLACLDHIKLHHAQEFALLLSKGAIDTEAESSQVQSTEDDEKREDGRGKYPDYANRKVICAFCVRRFWSTEDLRRHMRTHSGERPFQCDICLRKFTLKHSMLRHMKKHGGGHNNNQQSHMNSGSDMSDDEQPPASLILANSLRNHKIQEILARTSEWRNSSEYKENIRARDELPHHPAVANSDLIGNMLGISDPGILNKLLSSPDEAAKLLGVDK